MNNVRRKFILLGMTIPIFSNAYERDQGKKMTEQIHEVDADSRDGYIQPLAPLATVGEKLNVLVHVKKAYPYTAHFVFVEQRNWPQEKKDHLNRIYEGFASVSEDVKPYPVKLRFQFDSVDAPLPVHVDLIHDQRDLTYGTYYPNRYPKLSDGQPSVIWRAQGLWGIRNLEPGIYRVRIENLSPCPEIDFETLLQFYVNRRKA